MRFLFPYTRYWLSCTHKTFQQGDSLIRSIKKEEWMQLLQSSVTDYVAKALLYSLYNRDTIVLFYHRNIDDWLMNMKDVYIKYWENNLWFCKENYKIEK